MKKLRGLQLGASVQLLTEQALQLLKAPSTELQLGYYEPGHGTRGKKRYIMDDDDLEEMKTLYERKKEVLLWCYDPFVERPPSAKKHKSADDNDKETKVKSRSRFENTLEKKMKKVEEVFQALQKKHGSYYKPEQLRAWANLIQMDKHASLEEPPTGRFFNKSSTEVESSNTPTTTTRVCPSALSPTKRLALRSQCIEQLEKWHQLMECGAISKDQYEELQAKLIS